MSKIIKLVDWSFEVLKSRTVWTVIALVLVNGVPSVEGLIPAAWLPAVNGLLGILAIYFRVSPKQEF